MMYEISKIITVAKYTNKEPKGSYQLLMKLKARFDETIRNHEYVDRSDIASFGNEAIEIVAEFEDCVHSTQLAHCYTVDEVVTSGLTNVSKDLV